VRLQIAQNERAQAERGFAQEFTPRAFRLSPPRRAYGSPAEGVKLAESNLNTSIARYRAGEAQIVEVTDAQTTLAAGVWPSSRRCSTTNWRSRAYDRRQDNE
jgi:outer membrane protein TolC